MKNREDRESIATESYKEGCMHACLPEGQFNDDTGEVGKAARRSQGPLRTNDVNDMNDVNDASLRTTDECDVNEIKWSQ